MIPKDGNGPPARFARRGFLGALAAAPAALACATSGAKPRPPPVAARGRSEDSHAAREKLALDAVRSLALARDAAPAIVFRAAAARPGGTR
jgi:hypothetical protein